MFYRSRRLATSGARLSQTKLWTRLLTSLTLLLTAFAAQGGDGCGSEALCFTTVPAAAGVELRAVNREVFPITLKFDVTPINMRVQGAVLAQQVLLPGQSAALVQLQVNDPEQPWDYRYQLSWTRGDYRIVHDDSYAYALPYRPGLMFEVSQGYNGTFSHIGDQSYAIDFAMPEGTPVVAAREGWIVGVRTDSTVGGPSPEYADAANYVVVQHADGSFAEYLHLQPNGVRVRKGDWVQRGQLLGLSGNTGFSGGPHLHFMVSGATAEGVRQSFPVQFQTSEGIVAALQAGQRYLPSEALPPADAVPHEDVAVKAQQAEAPVPAAHPPASEAADSDEESV